MMLEELKERLEAAGVPVDKLRIIADSWESFPSLTKKAAQIGFTIITEGKGSFVFSVSRWNRDLTP